MQFFSSSHMDQTNESSRRRYFIITLAHRNMNHIYRCWRFTRFTLWLLVELLKVQICELLYLLCIFLLYTTTHV